MKANYTGDVSQIPNNLPPRPHPFIDREREVQQATSALLGSKVTTVALVGMAGIGKTTLALEIAHRLLDMGAFAGGIIWLSARSFPFPGDLIGAVETSLNVSRAEANTILNSQQCLFILDGLNELDSQNAIRLLRLLPPKYKSLITSRQEPALLRQSATIPVGPFSAEAATELLESLNALEDFEDPYLQQRWKVSEIIHVLGYHPLALTLLAKLLESNYEDVQGKFQQLLAVSDQLESERERSTLLRSFAILSQERGNYPEALQLYKQALEIAKRSGDQTGEASVLKSIGDLHGFLDEHDSALDSYTQALAIFRQVGDLLGEANVLQAIGNTRQFRDERDAALDSYSQALSLFRQAGDRLGEANTLKAIGDVQQFRKELDTALDSYSQALALFRQVGARLGEANVLQAVGDVQQFRKELDAALDSYSQALALFRQVGARLGEANALHAVGNVQQFRDDLDAALDSYSQALALFRQVGDRLGEANTLKAIGDVQQFRKELDAALDSYAQALALFRQAGARLGEANTLKTIGDVQQFRYELNAALDSYTQALALFRTIGSRLGEANTLKAIGDIQQFRKDLNASSDSYTQALALFRAIGDRLGEANTLQAIGDAQRFRGEYDAARESYYAAMELFQITGSRLGEANTLTAIGQLLANNQPQVTSEVYQKALAIYEQIGDGYSEARALHNLGLLYRNQGDLVKAVETLKQSQNRFAAIGLAEHPIVKLVRDALATAEYDLGSLYIEQDRWYDALHLFEESLAIYRQSDDLNARAETIYQIARTHHLIGNLDKARTHYRDALRLFEHIQNQPGVAICNTGLGRLMIQMGFLDDAIRELESARQIYKNLGKDKRMGEVEEMLRLVNHVKAGNRNE